MEFACIFIVRSLSNLNIKFLQRLDINKTKLLKMERDESLAKDTKKSRRFNKAKKLLLD